MNKILIKCKINRVSNFPEELSEYQFVTTYF